MRTAPKAIMTSPMEAILSNWSKAYAVLEYLKTRSKIILLALQGLDNREIAKKLSLHYNTVSLWRNRFVAEYPRLSVAGESGILNLRGYSHKTYRIRAL